LLSKISRNPGGMMKLADRDLLRLAARWGGTCCEAGAVRRPRSLAPEDGSRRHSPTCRAARNGSGKDSSPTATRPRAAHSVCPARFWRARGGQRRRGARDGAGCPAAHGSACGGGRHGIAGPDGAVPGKPVGTVWFCWAVSTAGAYSSSPSGVCFAATARPCGARPCGSRWEDCCADDPAP